MSDSSKVLSIFPEGGAVHGVCVGLQASSVIPFKIFAPNSSNGHLVEITELQEELDGYGTAAHNC